MVKWRSRHLLQHHQFESKALIIAFIILLLSVIFPTLSFAFLLTCRVINLFEMNIRNDYLPDKSEEPDKVVTVESMENIHSKLDYG
jgi:hypothetical protein